MSKSDLAAKLWEMANLDTGFAIARILILIFSIPDYSPTLKIDRRK